MPLACDLKSTCGWMVLPMVSRGNGSQVNTLVTRMLRCLRMEGRSQSFIGR